MGRHPTPCFPWRLVRKALLLGGALLSACAPGPQAPLSTPPPGSPTAGQNRPCTSSEATSTTHLAGGIALGANAAWVVGATVSCPLSARWDGHHWQPVLLPTPGGQPGGLTAIAAVSAEDLWAVGSTRNQPLIEHWDGTRWQVVSSPALNSPTGAAGTSGGTLNGVAALSATQAWAVGAVDLASASASGPPCTAPLIEAWNGTTWQVTPTPALGLPCSGLASVVALSPTNAWAVGGITPPNVRSQPLLAHWDGTRWSRVAGPSVNGTLTAVAAASAIDVWAVGGTDEGLALVEHYDGARWSVFPAPTVAGLQRKALLFGVTALSINDVWAVGPMLAHWDGTRWSASAAPAMGNLYAVATHTPTDIWAVGDGFSQAGEEALILHWDGVRWSMVPLSMEGV